MIYGKKYQNFTCDRCGDKYYNETAYSLANSLKQLEGNDTYCSNCVEISEEVKKSSIKSKKSKDFGVPPLEASENLRSLQLDKRTLRKTNRVHQFNTSVSKE
jgi:hypothetical protein